MRLNQLPTVLDGLTYPLTAGELAAAFEGETLVHPVGEEPLSAVVERCGSESMSSPDDAWLAVVSALDEDAIGRKFYTDRDPPRGPGEFDAVSC